MSTAGWIERLADIVSNAEGLGYLDHKYAEVMHQQLYELINGIHRDSDATEASLIVAQAEVQLLEDQRDAVRAYLGERWIPPQQDERGFLLKKDDDPIAVLRTEVARVMAMHPNATIHAIKELRSSIPAGVAWMQMGGGIQNLGAEVSLGLATAKDLVIHAQHGMLLTPKGKYPL